MTFPLARKLPLAAFCIAVAGCGSNTNTQEALQATVKNQAAAAKNELSGLRGATMRGAELRGGDSKGRPLWSVGAKEIRTSGNSGKASLMGGVPKQAVLIDARATLYQEGKPDTTLKAPRIDLFNTPTGVRLHLTGGVTATSAGVWAGKRGPVTVKSPIADVDVAKKIMAASGGVHMVQGDVEVQSAALRSETALKRMHLTGGVTANGQGAQLKATTADWDWEKNLVQAQQPVAVKEDVTITGAQLTADTNAQRGEISGGATATSPKGKARAPRVKFDWAHDRIEAASAIMTGDSGELRAGTLVTDSKLRVSSAQNLTVLHEGATITARSASGFNKLTRLQGEGVTYVKDGTTVTAGDVSWGGGRVSAQGKVTLKRQGLVLTAARVDGDDGFKNAVATGGVRGKLPNGGTLAAPSATKSGERLTARNATASIPSQGELGKLTLRGDQLDTDIKGEDAVLKGHVQVTSQSGAVLRAPEAHYVKSTGKITAKGGVFFKDPRGLEQRGDTLVADVNLKEAVITNVHGKGTGKLFEGKQLFR